MKIAIIGGGSTYSPELIEGFINNAKAIGLTDVALMDIDPRRREVVGGFAKRMVAHAGNPFTLEVTDDRVAAIDGATFVLTQIRVGGQAARHEDIKLGLRHDLIGQETTGIGGMAKALRTLPVVMDLCKEVEQYAPGAWMINFTNPSGLITEAILNNTGVQCIGLCNVPIEAKMNVAKYLGVDEKQVDMDFVGLNHLGWIRSIVVEGKDISDRMIDFLSGDEGPKNIPDIEWKPETLQALGAVPLWYNRYYYHTDSLLAELKAKTKSRAQEVMEIEEALMQKYLDPAQVTKPPELDQRGGAYYSKIAVEIIDSIANDKQDEHIINVQNRGAIPDFPDNWVVETVATVGKNGAVPKKTTPLDPHMRSLIGQAKAYEQLTIEAALNHSWNAAYRALITNPLGPKAEYAKEVLEDLLATNGLKYS